ncbi:MAG: winged helix-turn-helix domain-containing protein [Acidilobus sp.]
MADDVFEAISHPTRRAIVKALGQRGRMTFTELMDAAGVKDTGTMTFHLRRLSGLIRRTEAGDYELTDLGRRAYEAIAMVEGGQQSRPPPSQPQQVTPAQVQQNIVVISDRITVDVDRALLEDLKAQGKRLLIEGCVMARFSDDIDEQLARDVIEGVREVAFVRVPKRLRPVLETRMSDVAVVLGPGVSALIGEALSLMKARMPKYRSLGEVLYSTTLPEVRNVELDLRNSSLSLRPGEGRVAVRGREECRYDVNVDGDSLTLSSDSCGVELSLPRGATELKVSSEDSSADLSYPGLSALGVSALDSIVAADLDDVGPSRISLELSDSSADLRLSYRGFEGESNIVLRAEDSSVSLSAFLPQEVQVVPVVKGSEDSVVNIDVDRSLQGGKGKVTIDVSSSDSSVKAVFRRG